MLEFETCYRSRYQRPRGFLSFRGDVFVFVRLFGLTTSDSCVVMIDVVTAALDVSLAAVFVKLFIQCFCGKSFSEIFCTQTIGCNVKSIDASFAKVGDRKNLERVDIFLSVRSKMLVVGATANIIDEIYEK